MERNSQERVRRQQQEQNLYGAWLFMSGEHDPDDVENYIITQEKGHLAEGLELQQRSKRILEYQDGEVYGFGGQTMTMVNVAGYNAAWRQMAAGDVAAWALVRRRQHDKVIGHKYNELMANGEVGDGFLVFSPYEEEVDGETAERLGFWPEFRRSYVWLYRKKSEHELECVDVSIDQSSLDTYKAILGEKGVSVDGNVPSHEIPAYPVTIHADTEIERDKLIDDLLRRYRELNNDPQAKAAANAFEAIEFLDLHATEYLKLTARVHKAVAETLASGNVHELVRLSASRALRTLKCLSWQERRELEKLVNGDSTAEDQVAAMSTVITAQRYGIWQAMNKLAGKATTDQLPYPVMDSGIGQALYNLRLIDEIYANTNEAAAEFKTQPGCAGGTSFLQQNEADVKSSIFNKEKYSFNKKMFCVVCQAPPKHSEKPKWCGPCGICRTCDSKLTAKTAVAA